jgi:type I restriction enzyme S subunit
MDNRVDGAYPYYGASGPIDRHNEFNFDGEYLIVAQDGTIGCASVARGKFWANNHVWILRIKAGYDIDAIAQYLDQYYPFWLGMTTGSVVPKVTAENLLAVEVPKSISTAVDQIGNPLRFARSLSDIATNLVQAAKLLVEGLIERSISEAELALAQSKADSGDYRGIGEILARLHEGGIDVTDTRPLFRDLDAFFQTIQLAEQALVSGEQ